MSTTEKLIRKKLFQNEFLTQKLARFIGLPAIFFQNAPDDKSSGWDDMQYPRLVFVTDSADDSKRDYKKSLSVDIMCSAVNVMPEELEPHIKNALSGVFFTPEDGETFSAKWKSSQIFRDTVNDVLVLGMTVSFDIYEYPLQETSNPDPIISICNYAESWDNQLTVIGMSELPGIFVPERNKPAVWFSRGNKSISRQTNTVVWMDDEIIVHFFAPKLQDRMEWLEQFSQCIALAGELIMPDKSPMFVKQIKGNTDGDEISGQITISVQYGLLRRPAYAHTMISTKIK